MSDYWWAFDLQGMAFSVLGVVHANEFYWMCAFMLYGIGLGLVIA